MKLHRAYYTSEVSTTVNYFRYDHVIRSLGVENQVNKNRRTKPNDNKGVRYTTTEITEKHKNILITINDLATFNLINTLKKIKPFQFLTLDIFPQIRVYYMLYSLLYNRKNKFGYGFARSTRVHFVRLLVTNKNKNIYAIWWKD